MKFLYQIQFYFIFIFLSVYCNCAPYCDELERNLTFLGFENRCRLRRRFQCEGYIFPTPLALYNAGDNTQVYCHLGRFSDSASLQQETDGTHVFIAWNGPEYSDALRTFDDVDIVVIDSAISAAARRFEIPQSIIYAISKPSQLIVKSSNCNNCDNDDNSFSISEEIEREGEKDVKEEDEEEEEDDQVDILNVMLLGNPRSLVSPLAHWLSILLDLSKHQQILNEEEVVREVGKENKTRRRRRRRLSLEVVSIGPTHDGSRKP